MKTYISIYQYFGDYYCTNSLLVDWEICNKIQTMQCQNDDQPSEIYWPGGAGIVSDRWQRLVYFWWLKSPPVFWTNLAVKREKWGGCWFFNSLKERADCYKDQMFLKEDHLKVLNPHKYKTMYTLHVPCLDYFLNYIFSHPILFLISSDVNCGYDLPLTSECGRQQTRPRYWG